ncbi:hypothetical protein [Pseudomonas halotolerans]|uniref:hypothetical protein n=1 Tax=Pseudomonas halotolerans TaxID=3143552 RepID=UPI0031CEACC4
MTAINNNQIRCHSYLGGISPEAFEPAPLLGREMSTGVGVVQKRSFSEKETVLLWRIAVFPHWQLLADSVEKVGPGFRGRKLHI